MVFGSLTFAPTSPVPTPPCQSPQRSMARSLVSILRVPSASNATAPRRPARTVRFNIPAPRIHETSLPSPSLRVASHPSPLRQLSPEAGGSRSLSSDGAWSTMISRHARREERRMASGVVGPISRRYQQDAAALRFKRRTEGKCGRWLAPLKHHSSTACRDPVRCLTCNLSGRKERACPLRLAAKQVKPTPARPPPCHPSSSPIVKGALSWAKVAEASLQALSATHAPPDPVGHSRSTPTSSTSTPLSRATTATRAPSTQARHSRSAPTSSTSSDLALGNRERAAPVSTLRSFADVLMARPEMDVCSTMASRVLASERCYKTSVDDVLSAENERADLGLLQMQGKDDDRKAAKSEVLLCLSTTASGEVLPEVSRPTLKCSPLLTSSHPLLSPDAGLTMVLLSPSDASCEGGHPSVDVESVDVEDEAAEGEMHQLLPCLDPLGQQVMLLDGEEVAQEDCFENDGDLVRCEFQPDVEAATLGNLLAVDADEDTDDDDADARGTASSSGIVIRCVADLFSLPAVSLLPMPLPSMPRAPVALPTPERRSSRLAAKPQLPAVEKAQRVLHKKMGLDVGDIPLVQTTKKFANTCKKAPFSDSAINGLRTLFKLNLPSMRAADEALIGLAGPGGRDFPPPTALDVSA